jgi:FkbM family methyltransferase
MKYKFIEIGSCDFNTQIDSLTNNEYGICVDPIKYYLDNLPNTDNLFKENSAVSNSSGSIEVFYIPAQIIEQYNFPEWFKGCNSVNSPHPTIKQELLNANIDLSIINKSTVDCITYEQLVLKYKAINIDYLKIDTEGHEPSIIDSLCQFYASNKNFNPPSVINFEAFIGKLVSQEDINLSIDKLKNIGYKFSHTIEPDIYMVLS